MSQTPNYITPQGLKTLQEEYKELMLVERPKIVEVVSWAAGNGDRSENGDYIYGKRRLREIDKRLRFLSQRMDHVQVIDPAKLSGEKVIFGAMVSYVDESGSEQSVQIVGEDESNPAKGRISWRSPLAVALLGKKAGDEVLLKRPKGNEMVEITAVQFK